jgi:HlyD family secretion protein
MTNDSMTPDSYRDDTATKDFKNSSRHSDDVQDIINSVPTWVLRWGITVFFSILVLVVGLSALVHYPDIVKATLTIESPNSPKPVISKVSGKLIKILVAENELVTIGHPLAYLESTASHEKVLALLNNLKTLRGGVLNNEPVNNIPFNQSDNVQFGEIQSAYQIFYVEFLAYKSSVGNGFLLRKKGYLQKDLGLLSKQQQQLDSEKNIEIKDLALAADEYGMHKKLAQEKVETPAELRQEESKYLAKKSPLVQTESAIITGSDNYAAKQKEILELDNQVQEEKGKFLQAINSLLSVAQDWKSKYVLSASQAGKLSFAGVIQENQILTAGQEVFYINPGNEQFFGEMAIPQNGIGKVKEGEEVLVKLRSYPFEEYGMIRGRIKQIADVPYRDSVFIAHVAFQQKNTSDMNKTLHIKPGMKADGEIITQDATILQRLSRNFFKMTHNSQ